MPQDTVLDDVPPMPEDHPQEPKGEKKKKKTPKFTFLGLWTKGEGNEPIAYFDLSLAEKAKTFADALFGEDYILAKVLLESRPLITRSNLGGAKNLVLEILDKNQSATE